MKNVVQMLICSARKNLSGLSAIVPQWQRGLKISSKAVHENAFRQYLCNDLLMKHFDFELLWIKNVWSKKGQLFVIA